MKIDAILLPAMPPAADLPGRTAVVFDVLRATTMTAALAAWASEVRLFASLTDPPRVVPHSASMWNSRAGEE